MMIKRKHLKSVLIGLLVVLNVNLSVYAQEDKDPEMLKAMLDVKKTNNNLNSPSLDSSSDPLEALINSDTKTSKSESKKVVQNTVPSKEQKIADEANNISTDSADKKANDSTSDEKTKKKPKKVIKKPETIVLTKEESELLQKIESNKNNQEILSNNSESKIQKKIEDKPILNKKPIYIPAPVEDKSLNEYYMERDSSKIITKAMSSNDVLNVYNCFSSGVTISLDDSVRDEFTDARLDDKLWFDAEKLDNNRGAFVHLTKPVAKGQTVETAIRFTRKKNGKHYVITLVGLPCVDRGLQPFPKVVYLKDNEFASYAMETKNLMPPEDTIIVKSKGYPRVQKNRIRIADMLSSGNSKQVVFTMEVQSPDFVGGSKKVLPKVVILDNLQVDEIDSKLAYIQASSQKVSEIRGPTMRFRLAVNIDKDYILRKRYVHLMYIDDEDKIYQYIRIDTLKYFQSLVDRGFDL